MDKKNLFPTVSLPKGYALYPLDLDLNKQWAVCYYDINNKRVRIRKGINSGKTVCERIEKVNRIINDLEAKKTYINITQSDFEKYYDNSSVESANKKILIDLVKLKVARDKLSKKTRQSYVSVSKQFCEFIDKKLNKVTKKDAENYILFKINETSPVTAKNHKSKLHSLFKDLIYFEIDNIKKNPFENLKRIRAISQGKLPFKDHHKSLLKPFLIEDEQLWLLCQMQYYCFLRPNSEARILQVKHIDLIDGKIYVPSEISKTNKSQYVAISESFLPTLHNLKLHKYPKDYYVFGKNGRPSAACWSVNYFTKKHNEILKNLGFDTKYYSLYSWKNTGMYDFIKNGGTVKKLQTLTRHHSLDMLNVYLQSIGAYDLPDVTKILPTL